MNTLEKAFLSVYTCVCFTGEHKIRQHMYVAFSAYLPAGTIALSGGRDLMRFQLPLICSLSLQLIRQGKYILASNMVLFKSGICPGLQMTTGHCTSTAYISAES